ncbi:helix-turn-helix domain-containing protein [Paenibacillus dendritiformis]|uniref:helix-turn-helix domain-containing protein n=1 Tax=Paenibacillus dendritiformis TaxID=130049 RepID=UPI0034D96E7B
MQLIADYIKRTYGYSYLPRGLSKRRGLSYMKPTYTLAAADPVKQEQFGSKKRFRI